MNATVSAGLRRRASAAGTPPNSVYFLLGLFVVLEYTRVPSLIPVLGVLRSQMFLLLVLFFAWFRYSDRTADLKNPIVRLVLAFASLCALSIFFTPNTRAAFNMMLNILTYLAAIILPLLAFVKTADRLKWFLQLFVASNTFIAFWALTHGGTGPGGFITDENDCALVLNVAMPFALALVVWPGQTRVMRIVWAGCAALCLFGAVATLSRGGFLGIVAYLGTVFWFSRSKLKVIGIALVCAVIFVPLAPVLLPPRYIAEIESINNTEDGTRQNRIYFWKLGWMMYTMNPVFGVGAGNYPWTVANYERLLPPDQLFRNRYSGGRPAHSLYFTLLPELGTAGVVVFGSLVYCVIQNGRRARIKPPPKAQLRAQRGAPPPPPPSPDRVAIDGVGRALVASCVAYLATGAFISVLYYPSFWHLAGIAAAVASINATLNPKAPSKNVPGRPRAARA
jgi:O-antigen ligase